MHLHDLLRLQVDLQSNVLYKVRRLDCKGALLPIQLERGRLKGQFASVSALGVFDCIVAEQEVSG
jgi:hypothetical protein